MSKVPTLPNELWTRILKNAQDEQNLPYSWMSYRFVCRDFRTTVESIFRDQHLRKTWIRYDLGDTSDENHGPVILDIEFNFSHLSEDKQTAVFKTDDDFDENLLDKIKGRLEGSALDDINVPKHLVQVHRDLNDTPIPGLSIDYEKLELSCDWKGLFTRFYGEDLLYYQYQAVWAKEKEEWVVDLGEKARRGELDMAQMIQKTMHAFADAVEDSRYKARTVRQRHQYRERGEEFRILEESAQKALMKRIAKVRQLASLEDDSDYDFDDEAEDHSIESGGDENDEWQADDNEGENEGEEAYEI